MSRRYGGRRDDDYENYQQNDQDYGYGGGRRYGRGQSQSKYSTTANRRIFVNGLSPETSWQDLKDHFKTQGSVAYAQVYKASQGERYWGIVEFQDPDEAYNAIQQLNRTLLNDYEITLREDKEEQKTQAPPPRRGGGGYRQDYLEDQNYSRDNYNNDQGQGSGYQVVVHGLPFRYSWQDLKDLFREQIPDTIKADIMMEDSGRSKGYGTVKFRTREAAQDAIEIFNNTDLEGRYLAVKIDRFA